MRPVPTTVDGSDQILDRALPVSLNVKLWPSEPLAQMVQTLQIQQLNVNRIIKKHAHPALRLPLHH